MTLLKNGQLHCPFLCPFYRKTGPFFDSRIQKSLEVFFMTFSFENLVSGQSKDNLIVRTTNWTNYQNRSFFLTLQCSMGYF